MQLIFLAVTAFIVRVICLPHPLATVRKSSGNAYLRECISDE